jgi:hypothetical protein
MSFSEKPLEIASSGLAYKSSGLGCKNAVRVTPPKRTASMFPRLASKRIGWPLNNVRGILTLRRF